MKRNPNRIKVHINSFNRPAQLELLLESIKKFDSEEIFSLHVQYSYSDAEFLSGYNQIIEQFPDVSFYLESRYPNRRLINPLFGKWVFNTYIWLKNHRFRYAYSDFSNLLMSSLKDPTFDNIMFLTDDCLFYSKIEVNQKILQLINSGSNSAYSLVLGKNIQGGQYKESKDFLHLDLSRNPTNDIWTYPFSVEGRIYNRKSLLALVSGFSFTNPNTLECILASYNVYHKVFATLYSNINSCLIGFELNRVQSDYLNNNIALDTNLINKYFLDGYKLTIELESNKIDTFRPEINRVAMKDKLKEAILYDSSLKNDR